MSNILKLLPKQILIFSLPILVFSGCNDSDDGVPLNDEANEFVWQAMNQFYYWQSDVPELDDNIYLSGALNQFLNNYSGPETLFSELLYEDDRFSWIVSDYDVLDASFQGVSKSFGYEFRLVNPTETDKVYGFVKYVVPPSSTQMMVPAYDAGLRRGDIFTAVDGVELTLDNYSSLLFDQDSYTLTLGELSDGEVVTGEQTVNMTSIEMTENPIHLSKVIDQSGIKVGYLVYNQFINNDTYHVELNEVFGTFVSEGVTELVLDLRYNPGGSLLTTRVLASMIYGNASNEDILGSIVYNEKLSEILSDSDLNLYFFDQIPNINTQINSLNISRIFIITSGNTASASELIIAGMLPYMEVTLIGTTTVGKNVGSATMYDSPEEAYLSKGSDLNPNHKYAIQPIISQLANSTGFTDYIDGFAPDMELDEKDLLGELLPLGDPDEQLLNTALTIIDGSARISTPAPLVDINPVFDSHQRKKHLETVKIELEDLTPDPKL